MRGHAIDAAHTIPDPCPVLGQTATPHAPASPLHGRGISTPTMLSIADSSTLQAGLMKPKTTYRRHRGVLSVMIVAFILTWPPVLGSRSPATAADRPGSRARVQAESRVTTSTCVLRFVVATRSSRSSTEQERQRVCMPLCRQRPALLFTNLSTDATFSLKANGVGITHKRSTPTVEYAGHHGNNVLILLVPVLGLAAVSVSMEQAPFHTAQIIVSLQNIREIYLNFKKPIRCCHRECTFLGRVGK